MFPMFNYYCIDYLLGIFLFTFATVIISLNGANRTAIFLLVFITRFCECYKLDKNCTKFDSVIMFI